MKKMPLQCGRMALVAEEFCVLIDGERGDDWIGLLEKVLPRLHVAVTALSAPSNKGNAVLVYDDEKRCDMFMGLSDDLQSDHQLCGAYAKMSVSPHQREQLCERMADNLADIYFDLKHGLELLKADPQRASDLWQYSFYVHWGKHLLDAECWLRAIELGNEPVPLPAWRWPVAAGVIASPV